MSDHNAIYLKVKLNDTQKDTIWRLNVGILNNKAIIDQIKVGIQNYLKDNNNGEVDPTIALML